MAAFRQPELPRGQILLIPQRLEDVIPRDHPVRYLDYLLRSEAFREVFEKVEQSYRQGGVGQPPYHPRFLVALYVYGMLIRIRSSRRLEEACRYRTDVMWLMAGQVPDHTTISNFIKTHGECLHGVFKSTIRVGLEAGLISLEHVAVDGTKIEADASEDSVKSRDAIEAEIEKEVARREEEFAANEAKEHGLVAKDNASPSDKLKRLEKALESIKRREDEASGTNKVAPAGCVTDPDARKMKGKKGRSVPNYNAQISVDAKSSMIVAQEVTDRPDDSGELRPQLEQVKENCGRMPIEVSADSAYNTGPALAYCHKSQVTTYMPDSGERDPSLPEATQSAIDRVAAREKLTSEEIAALPRGRDNKLSRRAFIYEESTDTYRCPMGATLRRARSSTDKQKCGVAVRTQYRGAGEVCGPCPLADSCCRTPGVPRTVTHDQYESHRQELRRRMRTEAGLEAYKKRGPVSETPFAACKNILGIWRFMRRGKSAVGAEWAAICAALNFRQLLACWMGAKLAVSARGDPFSPRYSKYHYLSVVELPQGVCRCA